ncbi:lactose synthase [Salvia divinorum]|uniref:Lactose synthase n=1 Tax=Salvia divinorum TaxID=28513 RepID=A0ABD1GRU5_SALDI
MAAASSLYVLHSLLTRRRDSAHLSLPLKSFFFYMPSTLALATSLLILLYISSTSNLFFIHPHLAHPEIGASLNFSQSPPLKFTDFAIRDRAIREAQDRSNFRLQMGLQGNDKELFHDRDVFLSNYKEMNTSLRIYIYPHRQDDPFANVLLPVDSEPGGNYASESYFKKVLMRSHFITEDPSEADLFFLPFSIASGGADHFYVACHSIGRAAMEKAEAVKFNAIQIVCSSSYYVFSYVAHKDASLPQIWPRQGDPPNLARERSKLGFFAGSINSPVREKLLQVWQNDSEISVHFGRLNTSYSEELLRSKFCLHVKGFEDILNWRSFSVIVATLDIPFLKKILNAIRVEEYLILRNNVFKVRKQFQWNLSPVDYDAFYLVMYELWLRRSSLRVIP